MPINLRRWETRREIVYKVGRSAGEDAIHPALMPGSTLYRFNKTTHAPWTPNGNMMPIFAFDRDQQALTFAWGLTFEGSDPIVVTRCHADVLVQAPIYQGAISSQLPDLFRFWDANQGDTIGFGYSGKRIGWMGTHDLPEGTLFISWVRPFQVIYDSRSVAVC